MFDHTLIRRNATRTIGLAEAQQKAEDNTSAEERERSPRQQQASAAMQEAHVEEMRIQKERQWKHEVNEMWIQLQLATGVMS